MSAGGLTIRPFRIEDYDDLVKLWVSTGLPYKPKGRDSREKIDTEMQRGSAVFLVAEIGGQVVGAVFGTHDGRKGWINRLVVARDKQQSGIGALLVEAAEEKLQNLGIEIIACLINDDNPGSMTFFRKSGYTEHRDIIYFAKKQHPDV